MFLLSLTILTFCFFYRFACFYLFMRALITHSFFCINIHFSSIDTSERCCHISVSIESAFVTIFWRYNSRPKLLFTCQCRTIWSENFFLTLRKEIVSFLSKEFGWSPKGYCLIPVSNVSFHIVLKRKFCFQNFFLFSKFSRRILILTKFSL